MEGWKRWCGKKIFLRLKNGRVYSGVVTSVDDTSNNLIFINIQDKFDKPVTIVHSEIVEIKEETK